jgi:hypothetical protein
MLNINHAEAYLTKLCFGLKSLPAGDTHRKCNTEVAHIYTRTSYTTVYNYAIDVDSLCQVLHFAVYSHKYKVVKMYESCQCYYEMK